MPSPISNLVNWFRALPPWRRRLLVGLLIFGALYLAWCHWRPTPKLPATYAPAAPSSPVAGIVKAPVPARRVMVYPKEQAARKLKLPPAETANRAEQIIAATDIKPTRKGARAVTFLNMTTGESRTLVEELPAPWLRIERKNEIGAGFDVSTRNGEMWNVYYRRDVLQVKGVIVSGRAEISGGVSQRNPEMKAGIQTRFEW